MLRTSLWIRIRASTRFTRKLSIESMYKQLKLRYNDLCGTKTSRKNSCRKSAFSKSDSESSSSGTKDALSATQFKGRCRRCGTFGHKAVDCPEKKNDQKPTSNDSISTKTPKKFNRNCYYCSKKGHREADCFKKKWDSKSGNLGKESEKSTEVMLCGFCEDQDIYKVDSMYELVDSLEETFQNLDLSHCDI